MNLNTRWWVGELTECAKSERTIFKLVENIPHHSSVVLPTNASNQDMGQAFVALIRDEIANIRNGLESSLISDREGVVSETDEITDAVFDSFQSFTDEQVMKVFRVLRMSWTQYPRKCIGSLSPVLTKITNSSQSGGGLCDKLENCEDWTSYKEIQRESRTAEKPSACIKPLDAVQDYWETVIYAN